MPYERCVWILALLRYFAQESDTQLADILGALRIPEREFHDARRKLEREVAQGVSRGDLAPSERLAGEIARATLHLAQAPPTLSALRALATAEGRGEPSAKPPSGVDETALMPMYLPKSVMPFGAIGSALQPASSARPEAHERRVGEAATPHADAVDETQELRTVQPAEVLPFKPK